MNINNVMDDEDGVVLPLHQKVHLVRKQLGCTSKEAVSLIMRKQQRLKTGQIAESFGDSIFQPCLSPGYSNKENRESNNALIEPIEKNVEPQQAVSAFELFDPKGIAREQSTHTVICNIHTHMAEDESLSRPDDLRRCLNIFETFFAIIHACSIFSTEETDDEATIDARCSILSVQEEKASATWKHSEETTLLSMIHIH